MARKTVIYLLIGALAVLLGLPVLATVKLPHVFSPNTPIKSAEVNADFKALTDSVNTLETSKQAKLTGSPCAAGQLVRGVEAGGKLECAVDQIGSSGSAGVSSLNGKTGSLVIQAGSGVKVDTAEGGKITVSATGSGSGGGVSLPYSGSTDTNDPAFSVSNTTGIALKGSSQDGNAVYGISTTGYGLSAYSEKSYGVVGFTSSGIAGVYGESKVSGAAGVQGVNSVGPGSMGVWGQSDGGIGVRGSSTSGTGMQGSSESGYGVKGLVSKSGTGVYGENTGNSVGAGVQGRADYVNAVGVKGTSTAGTGVSAASSTGTAIHASVTNPDDDASSVALEAVNEGQYGYGVRGVHQGSGYGVYGNSPSGAGVGGESANGIGVYGKGPTAMKADGNAVQSLGSGGWVKAMVVVNEDGSIARCFNSQATGALRNSGGCGFETSTNGTGQRIVDFGFDVSQRFAILTTNFCSGQPPCTGFIDDNSSFVNSYPTMIDVETYYGSASSRAGEYTNTRFTLIIF